MKNKFKNKIFRINLSSHKISNNKCQNRKNIVFD